jgi:hypothetical protein
MPPTKVGEAPTPTTRVTVRGNDEDGLREVRWQHFAWWWC